MKVLSSVLLTLLVAAFNGANKAFALEARRSSSVSSGVEQSAQGVEPVPIHDDDLKTLKELVATKDDTNGGKALDESQDDVSGNSGALRATRNKEEHQTPQDESDDSMFESFISNIVVPTELQSLMEKKTSSESLLSNSMNTEAVYVDVELADDSGRLLQATVECRTTSSGTSVICIAVNTPFQDFFIVFSGCPTGLTSVKQCSTCFVFETDGTPDDLADNRRCGCGICSTTDSATVTFDCSKIGSGDCVYRDCGGTCASQPPAGTSASPATTTSPPGSSLPNGCFRGSTSGLIGCAIINDPTTGFITYFTKCPEGLKSARDCQSCVILGPDDTNHTLTDNPTCQACNVCSTGKYMNSYQCPTLLANSTCPTSNCNGCIGPTTTKPPTPSPKPPSLPSICGSVCTKGGDLCTLGPGCCCNQNGCKNVYANFGFYNLCN